MQIERLFIISCKTFGGFQIRLIVNNFETLDEIVDAVLDELKNNLVSLSLESLLKLLEDSRSVFHIHDHTLEDILLTESLNPFYICSHDCHHEEKTAESELVSILGIPMSQFMEGTIVEQTIEDNDQSGTVSLL